jgi:hypothetical protein
MLEPWESRNSTTQPLDKSKTLQTASPIPLSAKVKAKKKTPINLLNIVQQQSSQTQANPSILTLTSEESRQNTVQLLTKKKKPQ